MGTPGKMQAGRNTKRNFAGNVQIGKAATMGIELIEDAFRQIAHKVEDGWNVGWWDAMANSVARNLGDGLVSAGIWERHPDGIGRRWFYRKIEKGGPARPK